MGKLIYSAIASLDGYVADEAGNFDWAMPDEEVHTFFNDLERPIGTYLYGRRMYEVMAFWETEEAVVEQPPVIREYAQIWRAADKVVYSQTLESVSTSRTSLERAFDPEAISRMKVRENISVGGPGLAAHALRAGLVDELNLVVVPVVIGGGTAWLPGDLRLDLALLDDRRFGNGVVHLHYRTRTGLD